MNITLQYKFRVAQQIELNKGCNDSLNVYWQEDTKGEA